MMLSDKQILTLCQEQEMITPFVDKSIKTKIVSCNNKEIQLYDAVKEEKIISYGLSSYGYDLSLADEFKVFYKKNDRKVGYHIDPKREIKFYEESGNKYVIIPSNSFALGRSNEYIKMPRDITGLATNKSTYARCGLNTPSTVLEAGWEGHLTIEMFNSTPHPIKVYANEGIVQILFFEGEDCLTSYADRGGKYQGQKGITNAKI